MVKCEICNKQYKNSQSVSSHKHKKHKNDKEKMEHKCKYCNKQYKNPKQIGGHTARCKQNPNYDKYVEDARKNSTGKKASEETKKKISIARKKYLLANPDKVPYLINHSSNKSMPQKMIEGALKQENIEGWISEFRNGLYSYDIAFPDLKIDIEIDGETHQQEKVIQIDKRRDEWTISQGWKILRIPTKIIYNNINDAINEIKQFIGDDNLEKQKTIDISKYVIKKKIKCRNCGGEKSFKSDSGLCQKCCSISKRKITRPKQEELLIMINIEGYKQTARKYGVTDNTIRKWVKFYDKHKCNNKTGD